jgi:hypothetical protein
MKARRTDVGRMPVVVKITIRSVCSTLLLLALATACADDTCERMTTDICTRGSASTDRIDFPSERARGTAVA